MRTDYVQRFLFEDLDIRGRLTCLTGAWRRMLDGRGYPESVAALLGRTTALNVLLGANQKDAGRVTLQVQGSGPIRLLVADCTAELRIRGMAQFAEEAAREKAERNCQRERTALAAHVSPAPKAAIRMTSSRFTFPARTASSRAIGIEAAEVFPYRSMLT